jgi:hypothetical protein
VPLHQLDPLLLAQLAEDLPDPLPERPEDHLLPVLGHDDHVVSAVPSDMREALPLSQDGLLSAGLAGPREGDRPLSRRDGGAFSPQRKTPWTLPEVRRQLQQVLLRRLGTCPLCRRSVDAANPPRGPSRM